MKISLLSNLFANFPLEKAFEIISAQGYDGIEIWGGRPHGYTFDMDEEHVENILKWKEIYNLEVSMYTPEVLLYPYNLSSFDAKERRETVSYLKHSVKTASCIGCHRMQITTGHCGFYTDKRKAWDWLTQGVQELAEAAEKAGVDLILEGLSQMEGNMVLRCDEIAELIERVGSPRVKGMIDMVTPMLMCETFSEYFVKLGDKMDYIHCIDSDSVSFDHMYPGSGTIPFEEALALIMSYGYNGWLSCELLSPRSPELWSHRYINLLKSSLKKAEALVRNK